MDQVPSALDLPTRDRLPTPGQAFALFGAAFFTLAVAAQAVEWLALRLTVPRDEWAAIAADPANSPLLTNGFWIVALTAIPELALGALVLLAVRSRRLSSRLVLPMTLPVPGALLGALLVVFGIAPLADAVHSWVLHCPWVPSIFAEGVSASSLVERAVGGRGALGLAVALLGLAVVPALVEEALFRGFVTAAFRGSDVAALLAPSVLFALFHLDPAQVAATLWLGLAFGLARLCTGSLVASMTAHAAYNGVVLTLTYAANGETGEAASLPGVVIGLAAAVGGILLMIRCPTRADPRAGAPGEST